MLLLGLLAVGCSKSAPLENDKRAISIWVAASASGTVDDLDDDFENETGIDVEVMPGPSSGLAKQIVEGAKADLFLSADKEMADYLAKKGLVAERTNLLTNHLVVITAWDSPVKVAQLSDLAEKQVRRLALAEPKVPAGEYARQALKQAGVLDAVLKKSIGGVDVLATLKYVALHEADAGIVYWSDTLGNSKVQVIYDIPDKMHEPIVYPLLLLKQGADRATVRRFYEYLRSPKAADKFRTAGFGTIDTGEMLYFKQ
ncbi:MAG TPA: molybdate ABC transporter substrate-binding protein [Pirellulales bacterium]